MTGVGGRDETTGGVRDVTTGGVAHDNARLSVECWKAHAPFSCLAQAKSTGFPGIRDDTAVEWGGERKEERNETRMHATATIC